MATAGQVLGNLAAVRRQCREALLGLGDLGIFSSRAFSWLLRRLPYPGTLVPCCYTVGVRSVPVVAITGLFIGMVVAIQSYGEFHNIGLDTRLGMIINTTVVRELGPVLAATMLAGRVGGGMAAELATMRISEQIDALACLGVNPVHYLVVPRFLACVFLIPLLTILADFAGVLGGALVCTQVFHIDAHHYWTHVRGVIGMWDLTMGLLKPMFFGAAIALISCQRGFHSKAGAEGVGRAATEAFVTSFIVIFVIDFLLAMFLNTLHGILWPAHGSKLL
jgi:phospholipid/cholesterol/gamma-HCH transport system permease protein